MVEEINTEVCRVCLKLKRSNKKKCISLFEKHNDSFISDSIISIANVKIEQGDGFPSKICPKCLLELDTALSFRLKCETSNNLLRNSLLVDKESIKSETETQEVEIKKEEPIEEETEEYLDEDYIEEKINYIDNVYGEVVNKTELELFDDRANKEDLPIVDLEPPNPVKKSKAIDLKLECHDCGGLFKSKCKLRVHWKKVHMCQGLICKNCKRTFKSFRAYHRHVKIKLKSCTTAQKVRIEGTGRSRVFHCKHCTYKSIRIKDMQTHILTHTGDKPFDCDICFRSFSQQSSLEGHRESSHKIYKAETTCHYCGKQLKGRNRIYKHLKLHSSKYLQCDICKKLLKTKDALIGHIQRHSGIKLFTCEMCASSFYTLSELCNHKRQVHNKHKHIVICNKCGYKTSRNETMKKHQKKHTFSETDYACNVCGTFLEDAETLQVHRKKHFAERKFECPHCDKKFLRSKGLSNHVRGKHKCTFLVNKTVKLEKRENFTPLSSCKNVIEVQISPLTVSK